MFSARRGKADYLRQFRQGSYNFKESGGYSYEFLDLLDWSLQIETGNRIGWNQFKEHPFFLCESLTFINDYSTESFIEFELNSNSRTLPEIMKREINPEKKNDFIEALKNNGIDVLVLN
jgi:hypothetical protein